MNNPEFIVNAIRDFMTPGYIALSVASFLAGVGVGFGLVSLTLSKSGPKTKSGAGLEGIDDQTTVRLREDYRGCVEYVGPGMGFLPFGGSGYPPNLPH